MLGLNPETHIDTNTSGSLSAAVPQLNWLQRSGGSTEFPPGIIQSARAAVAGLPVHRLMDLGVTLLLLLQLLAVSRSVSRSQKQIEE